jgi:hypothetical protein
MAEKKVIELEVKTDSVKSLKAQLREAQNEVTALSEKFGATSQEAINAAKKAAQLKDAIGDAKALTDAYNPDAKFNALSQSLTGVLNGFQAFEGALGLIGVESKEVQEQLLKVQSAMALAEGVSGVMESIDSFKTLSAQIKNLTIVQRISTAAQWLWNAAMAANPIGAIIVAITALIVAGYKLISWFNESADAADKANASMDRHTKALERQQKQIETQSKNLKQANQYQYDYAKAAGASSEQLRKLAIKHQEEELALAKKNLELAKSTYLREQDILASYRANDASEELIEKQTEIVKKAREATTKARESLTQEYDDLKALRLQQKVEIRQEETDANKEAQNRAKQAEEKRRELAKEASEKRIQAKKEAAEKEAKLELEQIELDEQRQEQAYQRKLDASAKAAEEEKTQEDKYRAEKLAAEEADEIRQEQAWAREQEGIQKLQDLKYQAVLQGFTLISDLAEVFGKKGEKQAKKAFQIQKAASLASAAVSTYMNATQAYASQFVPIPDPTSPIRGGIAAGIAVAAGLGNIAKIASQKFEGGGNLSSSTAPSGGGGGATGGAVTPQFNIVGNSQATNPLAGLGNQPIKAFVVSGEVTTAQSLDRQKVYSATFG